MYVIPRRIYDLFISTETHTPLESANTLLSLLSSGVDAKVVQLSHDG